VDGEEVPWEEVAKGYPLSKRKWVMLTPEELEAADPKAAHTIEILDFVDLAEIDPVYYDSTYYVAPIDDAAVRPYALLLRAMHKLGTVAIATMVMRTKQYLCALRPLAGEHMLALTTMQYADEIRPVDELEHLPAKAQPSSREVELAEQLVKSLSSDWKPERYKDEYREKVLSLIERKAAGEEIEAPGEAAEAPEVVDLAAALAASLQGRSGAEPRRQTRAKRAARGGKKPVKRGKKHAA
jgi:DNA end-binding protein Ku